ncbi:MAG: NUDIX hydrolase [Patescibacteria group bacterium]|jgi:ADP-ribose pyrophosphatase YjhB (NUDIX family)
MPRIIIASGPVIVSGGRVLLNKHGEDSFWKFCGGRVENLEAESLLEAAIREAKEEISVDIKIINPTPFLFHVRRTIDGQETDIILVHYLAELPAGQKASPGEGIREVAWIDIADLDKEELGPNIKPALVHFGLI